MFSRRSGVALLVSLALLTACGTSAGNGSSTDTNVAAPVVAPTPGVGSSVPATPPAATATSGSVTYDTSVGSGVDSNGYANLPLRAGAHRYFVNSATGSDSNGCAGAEQAGTPLKSIAGALACIGINSNEGDQILVAEGTSYSEALPGLDYRGGYSAAYPTVIESYDPSDPTNEGKYGRAANGRRPIVNTAGATQVITCCSNPSPNYLAIRGFDINPGDQPGMVMSFVGSDSYVLIENNIFRYTTLTFDKGSQPQAAHHVVRKNSFYGEWSATAHAQGVYDNGTDGLTFEDNVFWHNGWKVGVTRDEPVATGGPTMFRHPVYAQNTSTAIIYRRNLVVDGAADGGHLLGDANATDNVIIDCPIGLDISGGVDYQDVRPNGVDYQVSYNVFLGSANLTSADPRGFAIFTRNGSAGSATHHNLFIRNPELGGPNAFVFNTAANYGKPSYMDYHDNVSYLWSSSGQTIFESADATVGSAVNTTYNNNIWDNPASGTNKNIQTGTFPHPYTAGELYTALGFADKQAFVSYAIEHPEANPAPAARSLLFAGYGMTP